MGVYIKGMEMPRNCAECPLKKYMICKGDNPPTICVKGYVNEIPKRGIIPDCPLVPVPPHGRLIDADALVNELVHSTFFSMSDYNNFVGLALKAPTIIPAEEATE